MTNRVLTIVLILGVTAALLFEAGRSVLTPEGRWRAWLQALVAQQAADILNRQVQLGPVTDISLTGVEARDLAVAEEFALADGLLAEAERLRLSFDAVGMLRGQVAPAAAIDLVELAGVRLHVVRDEQGELNLQKLLPKGPPAPPEERFQGLVRICDTDVVYDDYALPTAHGGVFNVELTQIDAEIDLRRTGWAKIDLSAGERLGRVGSLLLEAESELDTGFVWATVRLGAVDAAWWYQTFVPGRDILIERGRVDIEASIGLVEQHGRPQASVSGDVTVRDVAVRLAALGGRRITGNLDASGTMAGVEVHHLNARMGGVSIDAGGFLGDFSDPVLDLVFDARATRPEELLDLAPEEAGLEEQLAGLDVSGPVLVSGALTGPLARANLSAQIGAPGMVRYADADLGEITAGPLDVRVDVLDLTSPNVRARAEVAAVDPVDVRPLAGRLLGSPGSGGEPTPVEMLAEHLEVEPLEGVAADVLWSPELPLAQTRLELPRVAAGDLEVSNLSADLALAGDVLLVRDLYAEPLGGRLTADAVVAVTGPEAPWAWARGETELDLSRLAELPELEDLRELGGTASARFAGGWDGEAPMAVAQVELDEPRWQQYGVRSAEGLVMLDADSVQVRGLTFEDPVARGWASGVMPFEGELAGSFGVADVRLAMLDDRFELPTEKLRGEAFISGDFGGTPDDPRVDATVRAFAPGWGDYSVDAAMGRVYGDVDALHIEDLYASAGRIVARVSGTLTPQMDGGAQPTPAEVMDALMQPGGAQNVALDGTVTLAGPVDRNALELAELQEYETAGAVTADIKIAGTLARPSARGEVRLPYAHYDTVATDDAILTVSLQGDVLELEEFEVPVGDALVAGGASVTSIYDEPIVSVNVSASNLVLQDLAPWQEVDLPLSGRVDLPVLSLTGPLHDLYGVARMEARDLELGREEIGGVSADVVFDENTLMLQRTTLALAEGTLSLGGKVELSKPLRIDEQNPLAVELSDVSIARLLRVAVPLAERFGDAPPEELAPGEQPLSKRLASLSMRLSGRLDGSVSVGGAAPTIAEDAEPTEAIRTVLEALAGRARVAWRDAAFDGKPLPDTEVTANTTEEAGVALTLEATEGDALITTDGTWQPEGDIDMLAEVSALDLALLRPWVPEAVESLGGRLNLTVQATGSTADPQVIGSLDILEPEVHGAQFDIISAPTFEYRGEALTINDLVVREDEEEFYVDGTVPFDWDTRSVPTGAEFNVALRADQVRLAIFPPLIADVLESQGQSAEWLAQVNATGSLSTAPPSAEPGEVESITLSGALVEAEPQAQPAEDGAPVRELKLAVRGALSVQAPTITVPWLGSPVEDLAVGLEFASTGGGGDDETFGDAEAKTVVTLNTFSARVESTELEASGEATLSVYEPAKLQENEYHFAASVQAPQQSLADGLTAHKLRGTLTLDTQADGTQLVSIDDLGADFGGGSVLLGGTVGVSSFLPSRLADNDFDLALVVDHARLRYSNLFLGTVDGKITFVKPPSDEPMTISGGLTISHAELGMPRSSGEGERELHGMPAGFPSPKLDLWLAIGPDVRVKTTGMAAPLEPNERALTVGGDPQRPIVQALVEVQQGEASVPGGVLDIQTAGVRLLVRPRGLRRRRPPVPLAMEGRVWATATRMVESTMVEGREVGPIEIQLDVSGTLPDNIIVQVRSVPPLSEEQIFALLGTAPFSGGGGLAGGGSLEDVMTEQFLSALGAAFRQYIFQPFEEDLKQLLGLSVFEVNFAFDQPVSLRLGGYLVEDLLVTYSTSVLAGTEEYDLAVSYKVERRFQVGFSTNERNDHRVFVEYVRTF